jgi:hypothetical protein
MTQSARPLTKEFMKFILHLLLIIFAATPAGAQSYIGGGVGFSRSTSDFDPTPVEFFGVGQKDFGRFSLRGLGGVRSQPQLPTLFQEGAMGYKQDGYELFARTEADLTLLYIGSFKGFVGVGGDFFYQVFPREPGGREAHYHSGINPLVSAGARFSAFGGRHRFAFTRIFQEVKAREFPYRTAYKPGGRLINLQHRGTLNPSYLEGWRVSHEYLKPISARFSFYFAGEGGYYKYKEFPIKSFADSYYERDAVVAFRFGVVYR